MLFAYGAALGALLGVELEKALLLVPAAVVISLAHLLLAGFESYLRGFAHDGVLRYLWGIGSWWPVSAITDQIRFDVESFTQAGVDPVLHGFDGTSASQLAALAASSLAGLLLGAWAYRREAR